MNTKIGRNDPCPCGSGKKYKKCCIGKFETILQRNTLWKKEEIEAQSIQEIIEVLAFLGVTISVEEFVRLTEEYSSAEDLSKKWFEDFTPAFSNLNEDYLWLAAWVLWEKVENIQRKCDETICDYIEDGFDLLDENPSEVIKLWSEAWNQIRNRNSGTNDINIFEEQFKGDIDLGYWCQELESEMYDQGKYEEREIFCLEFLTRFPKSNVEILRSIRRALGENYFALGQKVKGDSVFEELINDYPDWPWGYIGWSDMYGSFRENKDVEENLSFAKELLEKAKEVAVDEFDKDAILERESVL